MTNPYNTTYNPYENLGVKPYSQNYQQQAYQNENTSSPIGNAVTGAVIGFTGGTAIAAGIDYLKSRKPVKGGEVKDSFVKKVFDNMVKKDYVSKGKKYINEKIELLKKIDTATTPEKFKNLMKKYKKCSSDLFDGLSLKTVCNTLTKENLKGKVSAIKEKIKTSMKVEFQNLEDTIKLCWDSEKKKFVKPDNVDNKLFKIIKNTKNSTNWKKAFKTGGITAAAFAVLALGYSLFTKSSEN